MAKRNCSLDLSLSHVNTSPYTEHCDQNFSGNPQEMTIFHDGRVCFSDIKDLKVRAILLVVSRGMESKSSSMARAKPQRLDLSSQLCGLHRAAGLSMMKSLQRFLHERKLRRKPQVHSPYRQ